MADDSPRRPERPKQALSNQAGECSVAGDPHIAEQLADAMDVGGLDPDALTHGFHSYPARMHYAIARRCIAAFCPPGGRVLDPFCGSGTTLVEARLAGCEGWGTDLNPLGVDLTRLKSACVPPEDLTLLRETAAQVAKASEARVRERASAHAKLHPSELRWYSPHILKELAGLFEEIRKVEPGRIRQALTMVFSGLTVKFSTQRSDTSEVRTERRLRKGLPTEFFLRKSEELATRLEASSHLMTGPAPEVQVADAREVDRLVRGRFDLVLSSPPYGGTYDYVEHHKRRFAWLGYDPRQLGQREIGARRHADDGPRFERDIALVLAACRRVLAPGGRLVWLMGDGEAGGERLLADQLLERLAPDAGLAPVALASQSRPDFTGGPERREHLMLFAADGPAPPGPPRGPVRKPPAARPAEGRPAEGRRPETGRRPAAGRPATGPGRGPGSGGRGPRPDRGRGAPKKGSR